MAINSDVIVIGGGLAGLSAGIAAARAGCSVTVISANESTLRQASGLIDVLGYLPDTAGPVADPFAAMDRLDANHPYRIVGEAAVREGLELFDDIVGTAYGGGHTERNALVLTHGGRVKPTARYPATVAPGLASASRETLLVGFEVIPDFDAPLAAARLRDQDVAFSVRGVTLSFPGEYRPDAKLTRYVHALETNESIGDGETVQSVLVEYIGNHLEGAERVGLPAILGLERPSTVQESLSEALGAEVFEIPMGPPSVPGMRLAELLGGALLAEDGRLHQGAPVIDCTTEDGTVQGLTVDRNGAPIPYAAEEFVLATGGLVGKGIRADRERVSEPVLGLPVSHPEERYDWFDDAAFGPHAFSRFGVRIDGALRALDQNDQPVYSNVRAAGAVIAGFDFAAENAGSGVSLATGTLAGRRAAEEAIA